jgi:predicted dehydrogenase
MADHPHQFQANITRRQFARTAATTTAAAAAAFTIVPRHVLAGSGQVAPSDKVNLACIGMGRQGMAVMMDLMARPQVQVVSVCDCNQASKDYVEYSDNALLKSARQLLGNGYENWAEDLASPGSAQLTNVFKTSLGMGGREPAKRLVEAYYGRDKASGSYRGCTAYRDYRELLEREAGVDAVYVATPDHWHAPIGIAAMRKRKHVLGQKPMAHSVAEAHRMAAVSREMKVATSVTVNNPSSAATKVISSWIGEGAIGRVREVHNWSSRPFWPQGVGRPAEAMAVPEGMDWDLWLGPAPERPYHKIYTPFSWRGWLDFGCGSFGDMGCYSFAGIYKILGLAQPSAVEASASEYWEETYPKASIVHLDFPGSNQGGPIHLAWYDGGLMPPRPAGLLPEDERLFQRRGEGILYMGDKGFILAGFNGDRPRVYPATSKYTAPPRDRNAEQQDHAIDQWLAACKGGPSPQADFSAQAPVTEAFLLGCLSQRLPNERFLWDAKAQRVTNSETAQKWIDPPYRGNWS